MAKTTKAEKPVKAAKPVKTVIQYYEGIGRRKESVARVRLYIVGKDKTASVKGSKIKQGEIVVNGKKVDEVFGSSSQLKRYLQPLEITKNLDRFAISVRLAGGGINGQLSALIHGLARAIVKTDEATRPALKLEGLLTRDPRTRERRKVGTGGRARRAKQSPKR